MPRFLVHSLVAFLFGGVVSVCAAPSPELPAIAQKALEQNQITFSSSDLEFFEKIYAPF
jgi:hypothetical protein